MRYLHGIMVFIFSWVCDCLNITCPKGYQILHTIPGELTDTNYQCVKFEETACVERCFEARACHLGQGISKMYSKGKNLVYISGIYSSRQSELRKCCVSRQYVTSNCKRSIIYNELYNDGKNLFTGNPFIADKLKIGPNPATRFFFSQPHPNQRFSYALEICSGELKTDGSYCSPCGSSCENGGSCIEPENYPIPFNSTGECQCAAGWTGTKCEENIDDCLTANCGNNATCVDEVNSFRCECNNGYFGENCDEELNECDSNPCKNGAPCIDEFNSYTCNCLPGYSGQNCEQDLCETNPCWHAGTCIKSKPYDFSCECSWEYSGKRCEIVLPTTTTIPVTMTTYHKYPFDFDDFLARVENQQGNLVSTNWCRPNPCPSGGRCSSVGIGYRCQYNCITMNIYPGYSCRRGGDSPGKSGLQSNFGK